jgi:hypothetical protein
MISFRKCRLLAVYKVGSWHGGAPTACEFSLSNRSIVAIYRPDVFNLILSAKVNVEPTSVRKLD